MNEYDRDDREVRRVEEHARQLEARLRSMENEQAKLASTLDKEQSIQRQMLAQYKEVIERNTIAVFGDGDQREGLVNWKLNMERRYTQIRTQVLTALGTVGAMLVEFAREFLAHILK